MSSSNNQAQIPGVNESGVYVEPEVVEEVEEELIEMEVAGSSPQGGAAQQEGDPPPQQQAAPNIMRLTEEQIMAQVEGGQLTAGDVQRQGGTPILTGGRPEGAAPNIVVNHTYNIHYQSDRPSPEYERDLAAYGEQLVSCINARSLEKVQHDIIIPTNSFARPSVLVEPKLEVVKFHEGKTGIDYGVKYIPDSKYRKHNVRKLHGKEINFRDLHANQGRNRDRECHHVALVGNPGSGKTVLLKRYARMVLNREIPCLDEIEAVHYVDVTEMYDDTRLLSTSEMLIERLVRTRHNNICKHGYEWMRANSEKILFIFDHADKVIFNMKNQTERVSHSTPTTLRVALYNIITGHLFAGSRTIVATRDYAWSYVKGDSRPQKFVCIGPFADQHKLELTRSLCPGLQGKEFSSFLERRYPASFAMADDVMHLYFELAALQWGCRDRSAISTDVMLVISSHQNMIRSRNASREITQKISKVKRIAYNMIRDGEIRFGCRELRKHQDMSMRDMMDLVVVAPQHDNHVCFRLLDSDYSYFFPHQVSQEMFAACCIAEMDLPEFKAFLAEKIHLPKWIVVRRFLCGMMLHDNTKANTRYYVDRPKHAQQMEEALKQYLHETASKMESLSSFERLELLATLYECGKQAKTIIQSCIRDICLPDLLLTPSDVYAISQIDRHVQELNNFDVSLDEEINIDEFENLLNASLLKARKIKLDVRRICLNEQHVVVVQEAVITRIQRLSRSRQQPVPQEIKLLVNSNTSGKIFQDLKLFDNELIRFDLERVTIPEVNEVEMD